MLNMLCRDCTEQCGSPCEHEIREGAVTEAYPVSEWL